MTLERTTRQGHLQVPLVGHTDELAFFERVLDELDRGSSGGIELVGEPGVGKTRLLAELVARSEVRGHIVLYGCASELERELPFSLFVDALDEYVEGLNPVRLASLEDEMQAELGHVFPSLSAFARGREVALQHERYRSHRAVRGLLERLAQPSPVVLVLDDLHWADSASMELLGALLRRPPAAPVMMALAYRSGQLSERLCAALERADRAGALTRFELTNLTPAEARALLGDTLDVAAATGLYEESGGNPFYLEQLARARNRSPRTVATVVDASAGIGIPAAVADALNGELALLSKDTRLVLDGAAVAGDPFEPELAAAAAATTEAAAMQAVDDLLRFGIIQPTDVPRRFRFRHPLVRRAVYEAAAGGWRLGAHERCSEALAARGAEPTARAHHVERSAREGDLAAVALLRDAGDAAARLAPASAARWFTQALRILPHTTSAQDRVELLSARAEALAALGDFPTSHEALVEGLAIVPVQMAALRTVLTTRCARIEHRLGEYEHAHRRLLSVLDALPEAVSAESVVLLVELALNEFYRSKYESIRDWAQRAVSVAEELGDAPLTAAALAMPALADAMTGAGVRGRSHCANAAAFVDTLSDGELSRRLDAAVWLAAAELYLDRFAEADAHAGRALTLARSTGQGELVLVLHQILGRIWYVRAKLADATELLDGAIEASRLLGSRQALVGNLFNRSVVALAVGELDTAVTLAEESVDVARGLDRGFVTGWAAVRLAAGLLESGRPESAIELLLGSAGGDDLTLIPGGWRAYCFELLTRCWLDLGHQVEAASAAERATAWASTVDLPMATSWADRAAAAVALHAGDPSRATGLALASAAGADGVGAPIEAALSRTLAGRALGQAGQRDRAVVELQRAAAQFDACGADRFWQQAERELGKLGHRAHRRTRPGKSDGSGIELLTEREAQVARLAVEGRTNPQIAAELFLSKKTVETHLRNVFHKLGVSSRVALVRTVERGGRPDIPRPR